MGGLRMGFYLTLRKLVDADLSRGPRLLPDGTLSGIGDKGGLSLLPATVPIFVAAFLDRDRTSTILWLVMSFASFLILMFILWRLWRIVRARSIKSARYYERKGRYSLPPEYANSTSVTLENYRKGSRARRLLRPKSSP